MAQVTKQTADKRLNYFERYLSVWVRGYPAGRGSKPSQVNRNLDENSVSWHAQSFPTPSPASDENG
jgi:hypothetical protein